MTFLSKSKYCGIWQCPKIAWMRKYKPEELVIDDSLASRMEAGREVGNLARGLFGGYVDVTSYVDEKLDISTMIEKTKHEIAKGTEVICEAAFDAEGLYCAVDILKKSETGWDIYEVKSSTHDDEPVYMADIAYQKYVLKQCGVNVTGTYLVCLNNEYVFDGTLDIHQLFKITDVAPAVFIEESRIEPIIDEAKEILASSEEPDIDLSMSCNKPYP